MGDCSRPSKKQKRYDCLCSKEDSVGSTTRKVFEAAGTSDPNVSADSEKTKRLKSNPTESHTSLMSFPESGLAVDPWPMEVDKKLVELFELHQAMVKKVFCKPTYIAVAEMLNCWLKSTTFGLADKNYDDVASRLFELRYKFDNRNHYDAEEKTRICRLASSLVRLGISPGGHSKCYRQSYSGSSKASTSATFPAEVGDNPHVTCYAKLKGIDYPQWKTCFILARMDVEQKKSLACVDEKDLRCMAKMFFRIFGGGSDEEKLEARKWEDEEEQN